MFASLVLLMASATKKKKREEEAYPWKAGASSGHITNLSQSFLETFDIYALGPLVVDISVFTLENGTKVSKTREPLLKRKAQYS